MEEGETHVGHKVLMGQSPVDLEPLARIGLVASSVIPGTICRRARVDRAILSSAEMGARQCGAQEEGIWQKSLQNHLDSSLGG